MPHGFSSVPAFFESLISLGRKGLHNYVPVTSLLTGLSLAVFLLQAKGRTRLGRTEIFCVAWLVGSIVVIAPFNYQPLRYLYWLIVPMAVLSGMFLDRLQSLEIGKTGRIGWWRVVLLFLLLWYMVQYLFVHPFYEHLKFPEYYRTVWYSAIGAIVPCIALILIFRKTSLRLPNRIATIGVLLAVSISVVVSGYRYVEWYVAKAHNIDEAAADLQSIISPDAVVGGQYGPALVVGSAIRSFPYFLTTDVDASAEMFSQYPITHIAISSATWEGYCGAAPVLRRAPVVGKYWLRDTPVYLVRVAEIFHNSISARCPLTDLERAAAFQTAQKSDSARFYLERFMGSHPRNKSGLMLGFEMAFHSDPTGRAHAFADTLADSYPGDFVAQFMAASYYHWLATHEKSAPMEERGRDLLAKAIGRSPHNEENLRKMYQLNPPDAPVIK